MLGGKPGETGSGIPGRRVGYMPQETALYDEFSIKEVMRYFGLIFGMSQRQINDRLSYLVELLDLPDQNRLIKNLSGGQQRRTSFAAALLHNPELLILDEPTVGVDPILRARIWDHIVSLTNTQSVTVILTTHYIEEARKANQIGMMRSGVLLAEDSPEMLMTAHKSNNLEEIFFTLSVKQGPTRSEKFLEKFKPTIDVKCVEVDKKVKISPTVKKTKPKGGGICKKVYALMIKDTLRTVRNVGVLLMIFFLPVLQIVIFCLAIGRDPVGLNLAIVNYEVEDGVSWMFF